MSRRRLAATAALVAAGLALLGVELGRGALHYGRVTLADPCAGRAGFGGSGLDGAVQQLALDGLDGAACRLHTTREELVLSFAPEVGTGRVRWSGRTIAAALAGGVGRATAGAARRGGLEGLAARVVSRLDPARLVEWLLGRLGSAGS